MVYVSKVLYFFRNTPVPIPRAFFIRLDGMIVSFVWAGKTPRVTWKILQLPLSQGGLVLPNFQLYYWATVLVMVCWWFSQPTYNPVVTLKSALLGFYAAVYQGPKTHPLRQFVFGCRLVQSTRRMLPIPLTFPFGVKPL